MFFVQEMCNYWWCLSPPTQCLNVHIIDRRKKLEKKWTNINTKLSNSMIIYSDQDAYCFELLSMVLALSGSGVGRTYLAQQYPLLQDLFSLLHTGTPRIQRQVSDTIHSPISVHLWYRDRVVIHYTPPISVHLGYRDRLVIHHISLHPRFVFLLHPISVWYTCIGITFSFCLSINLNSISMTSAANWWVDFIYSM